MAIEPGIVVAKRYRVTGPLGKGGMGEVFAAENTRTGRMVAIKVLRAESKEKQSAIERFRREARAAGSIDSDFVTQVLDVEDDPDHGIVLVFELLEGESLVERLKRTGPIALPELWGMVEAVWMGLADAHEAGIIHRDLKPSNVFLEQRRAGAIRVKILDFGISKLPKKISTQSLTQVGQSLGTFSFMPPEQIGKAKSVDHRADIYACSTLIFQALSGKLPYHAKNVVAMMELKASSEPRMLSDVMNERVAPELDAFVARGLARNPDHRFQTAVDALVEWRRLRPPGALSLSDIETSGTYPQAVASTPINEEEPKTLLMRPQQAYRPSDSAPPTRRDGSGGARPVVALPPALPQNMPPGPPPNTSFPLHNSGMAAAPDGRATPAPAPANLGAQHSSYMGADAPYSPRQDPAMAPPPPSSTRTIIALFLGALGLMLVGFVTVALVLKLIGKG